MDKVITYTAIAIVIIIVVTAIYIGHILYKARVRKDLESSGGIQKLERVLELEPLPYEKKKASHEKDSQFSLGNSSITLSHDKEKKSSPNNSKRSAKSYKSKNGSLNSSLNGSRYGSKSDSSVNSSLAIKIPKIPKDTPPPPPPSPLKLHDNSIDSFLNIIPSDISESTQTAVMSSNASSPILSSTQLKSDLKAHSQPTFHDNYELA